MILAIDIGNSTVGAYAYDEVKNVVIESTKMPTEKFWSISEYMLLLDDTDLEKYHYDAAIISSVVPALTDVLAEAVRRLIKGMDPIIIKAHDTTLLKLCVDEPEKVGTDRIVDATWAAAKYPLPAVTVDMGTATTINIIDENKNFLGGMIAPGVVTSLRALVNNAAQLPEIPLEAPKDIIGKNTLGCMQSGAVVGAASMVDGMVSRIEKQLGKRVTLLMTGGLAGVVEGLVEHEHVYDPDMLVKGMGLMCQALK